MFTFVWALFFHMPAPFHNARAQLFHMPASFHNMRPRLEVGGDLEKDVANSNGRGMFPFLWAWFFPMPALLHNARVQLFHVPAPFHNVRPPLESARDLEEDVLCFVMLHMWLPWHLAGAVQQDLLRFLTFGMFASFRTRHIPLELVGEFYALCFLLCASSVRFIFCCVGGA